MYCRDCTDAPNHTIGPHGREGGAGADRFGILQCQRCGAPLPGDAPGSTLGRKMDQLARFGLADRAKPVADPAPPVAGDQ